MTKLTDLCDIQYGYAFDSSYFTEDSSYIPIVRIRDVKRGFSKTHYSSIFPVEYVIHKGDLLVGMDGEFNIAKWQSSDALLNQRVCKLTAKEGMNKEYLRYAMIKALEDIENKTSFVTVKHLTAKELNRLELNVPSVAIQNQRENTLSALEKIMHFRSEQLKSLDDLIKARFVEMFGTISEEVPLSYYIASLNAGKSLASEEENSDKVLKTGAVTYDYFDATQIKNLPINYAPQESHRVKAGDIIISRMNTAELVGATAYVWKVPEHVFLPDRLWRADVKETATPIFVWQMLIQSSTKKSIRRIASGTSGSMKNISKSRLLGINVVKAPINLQEQFADFVVQVDKSKLAVQKSLEKTQQLFDSLMQEYFG